MVVELDMRKHVCMAALVLAFCVLPLLARAAEIADGDYVSRYFGTSVFFITQKQLIDPNQGYWGNLLPQEFMYSQGTLIEVINKARRDAGRTDLLNPADYPIAAGMETKRKDGKWEYNIDFRGCTPSEAQLVLDTLKFTGVLGDCVHETRPLCVGYFNAQSQDLQGIELKMQDTSVKLTPDMSLSESIEAIRAALQAKFGDNCKVDIYFSANDAVNSGKATYVNVTVYLDGAEKQFNYGEGSERGVC
jgi:hypothetical protein